MPAQVFAPQIAYFQQHCNAIALGPHGQVQSAIPVQGYELEHRGRDIADLLDQLPPTRVVRTGWSLGVLDSSVPVLCRSSDHLLCSKGDEARAQAGRMNFAKKRRVQR